MRRFALRRLVSDESFRREILNSFDELKCSAEIVSEKTFWSLFSPQKLLKYISFEFKCMLTRHLFPQLWFIPQTIQGMLNEK